MAQVSQTKQLFFKKKGFGKRNHKENDTEYRYAARNKSKAQRCLPKLSDFN